MVAQIGDIANLGEGADYFEFKDQETPNHEQTYFEDTEIKAVQKAAKAVEEKVFKRMRYLREKFNTDELDKRIIDTIEYFEIQRVK